MGTSSIMVFALLIGSVQIGVKSENIIVSQLCGSNSPSSCVTLSQYISTNNTRAAVSLVLLPGVHTLMSPLRVQNGEFFYMQGQSSQVTVSCINSSLSPDFEFVSVNEVAISNLVFAQCSVNITGPGSSSSTVSISYAEFSGSCIDRKLNIMRSNNVSISHTIFQNHQSNTSTAILYFSQISNLKLSHCAIRGIHAYLSLFEFRGIDKTEIFQCNFTNNTLMWYGSIVHFQQTTSVHISCCEFEYNFIGLSGNVLYFAYGDSIGVISSTFSHNTLDDHGNIADLHLSSRLFGQISCSTFWNNSFIGDHSLLLHFTSGRISNSTFALNRQIGGIILYCSSSCTMISSVFNNNSVGYSGDIVVGQISIFASEFAHNSIGQYGRLFRYNVEIDCTLLLNNSFWDPSSNNAVVSRNSQTCNQLFVIGERATSTSSDCEGKIAS